MVRVTEKPLSTRALNAFFETLHAELDKSGFKKASEQEILHELASAILPIDEPHHDYKWLDWVVGAMPKIVGDKDYKLPESLRELKARITNLSHLNELDEVDSAAAEKKYKEILNIAYRAAEKEMGARSR